MSYAPSEIIGRRFFCRICVQSRGCGKIHTWQNLKWICVQCWGARNLTHGKIWIVVFCRAVRGTRAAFRIFWLSNFIFKTAIGNSLDERYNISYSYNANGKLAARYFYDGLNRLVRQDDINFGTVTTSTTTPATLLAKQHTHLPLTKHWVRLLKRKSTPTVNAVGKTNLLPWTDKVLSTTP